MFGVVPRELWQRDHPPDEKNRIRLNLTCPLVLKENQAVLIDTGIGNRLSDAEREVFQHRDGWLLDGLAALGMEPGDITHVMLSHLHFDHCGGVVRRRSSGMLVPAFPRARFFIQRGELNEARNSKNERQRAAYRHVAECLEPIGSQVEVIDGNTEVIAGVEARVTGGHTFDHQVALVRGTDSAYAHLADIVPTRSHLKPAWNQSYDLDALRTMEQKGRYLSTASDAHWWISFAHDDRIFAARARRANGKIELDDGLAVAGLSENR